MGPGRGIPPTPKTEVLHGLARTNSVAEWHVQIGNQAPRPLAQWVK
jgi:hypothetical protein